MNEKKKFIENYVSILDTRFLALKKFEDEHFDLMLQAKGSFYNHQTWEGGYYDHIKQCFEIATSLHNSLYKNLNLSLNSIFIVLFFHDIEKLWRDHVFDKNSFYTRVLPEVHGIKLTTEELNALQYIHGEGHDYSKDKRVMNELAGFCHACDVLSARCFYNIHDLQW